MRATDGYVGRHFVVSLLSFVSTVLQVNECIQRAPRLSIPDLRAVDSIPS